MEYCRAVIREVAARDHRMYKRYALEITVYL
jgi:hypothetical protein